MTRQPKNNDITLGELSSTILVDAIDPDGIHYYELLTQEHGFSGEEAEQWIEDHFDDMDRIADKVWTLLNKEVKRFFRKNRKRKFFIF